jgi:hypothetical protein
VYIYIHVYLCVHIHIYIFINSSSSDAENSKRSCAPKRSMSEEPPVAGCISNRISGTKALENLKLVVLEYSKTWPDESTSSSSACREGAEVTEEVVE